MNLGGEGKKKKKQNKKIIPKRMKFEILNPNSTEKQKNVWTTTKKRTKKNNVVNRGGEGIREVRTMKLNQ